MKIHLPARLLKRIELHGEKCYPHEGAGVLFGFVKDNLVEIKDILPMDNTFEESQRRRRYKIDAHGMMQAELAAEERDLEVVGIFHSHPDHPPRPSEYDLEYSLPWYTYLITKIEDGSAGESCAWRLQEDRKKFDEMELQIQNAEEEV